MPPVSLTPVANNGNNIRLLTPESELEGKNLYTVYVSSTTQRWPNKVIKIFRLKIFSICQRCRWHRWQTLSCEYLREFSKKFETVLTEYSGAGGKLIHEKNQKQKISWHCPFNVVFATIGYNIPPLPCQLTTARVANGETPTETNDKLDCPASPVDKTSYSSLLSGGAHSTSRANASRYFFKVQYFFHRAVILAIL